MRVLLLTPLLVLAACGPDAPVPTSPVAAARTPLEAKPFIDAVGALTSKSTDGIDVLPVRPPARAVAVRRGFAEVMTARVGPDGEVGTRCLGSAEAAEAFLATPNASLKRADR